MTRLQGPRTKSQIYNGFCTISHIFSEFFAMREEKIQRVLSILRLRHLERYATDEVDESYVRSMSDADLDKVIAVAG
jgi:hypothetical protein